MGIVADPLFKNNIYPLNDRVKRIVSDPLFKNNI